MAIADGGMKQKEAVKVFKVSQAAISKWMKAYKKSGLRGLAKKKTRPGSGESSH